MSDSRNQGPFHNLLSLNRLYYVNDFIYIYHILIVNPDAQVSVKLRREDEQCQEGRRAAAGHVAEKGCKFSCHRQETCSR